MKRKNGRWFIILFTFVLFCAGCGSRDDGSQTVNEVSDGTVNDRGPDENSGADGSGTGDVGDSDRIIHKALIQEMDIDTGAVVAMAAQEGSVMVVTSGYQEAEQKYTHELHKIDLTGDLRETVNLFEMAENETIKELDLNHNGNLMILTEIISAKNAGAGNRYFLYEATADGSKVAETEITDTVVEKGANNLWGMVGDRQGGIYLMGSKEMGSGMMIILSMDAHGTLLGMVEVTSVIEMFCTNDGSLYILGNGQNTSGVTIRKADFKNESLEAEIVLQGIFKGGFITVATGGATGILINDGTGIYECDILTGECVKLLDYMDSDVFVDLVTLFGAADGDSYWLFNQIYGDPPRLEKIWFTPAQAGEITEKKTIVYGTFQIDPWIEQLIPQFNQQNPRYRIEVKDYEQQAYESDAQLDYMAVYDAAMMQFQTDLLGDEGPDVICLNGVDYQMLASKGIIEDLSPYMEEDDTFRREDYLENVISAYEISGKCYGLTPYFAVFALVGSEEKLTGINQWSAEELIALANRYPESLLTDYVADMTLTVFLSYSYDQFVDWSTKECHFQGEAFISLLELANTLPITWEEFDMGKEILLRSSYIGNIHDVQRLEETFQGPVRFVGYPAGDKNVIAISSSAGAAMNASSEVKEGVWEFISFLMSEENQQSDFYGFPAKKSAFDQMLDEALTIPIEYLPTAPGLDPQVGQPPTKAQMDQLRDVLIGADSMAGGTPDVLKEIISEEAQSYFAGQKTAAEVAEIIQNRAQVYVNEIG